MSETPAAVTAPSTVTPLYFSDRTGPGDTAELTQQLVEVIRRERAARGLPVDGAQPAAPPSTLASATVPAPPVPAAPAAVSPESGTPPAASSSPPEAPTSAAAAIPAAAEAGAAAEPSAIEPPALSIPIRWQDPAGKPHAGALAVERVESIPGRPGDVYVVGRWPTGQGAVWEIPTLGPWGRGTTIKVRWETGPATNQWAAGLFQVESVERSVDGLLARGLWPQGERGTLLLPPAVIDGRWHAMGGAPAEDEARAQPAMTREA